MKKLFLNLLFIHATLSFAELSGKVPEFKHPSDPGLNPKALTKSELAYVEKLRSRGEIIQTSPGALLDMTNGTVVDLTGFANSTVPFDQGSLGEINFKNYVEWYVAQFGNQTYHETPLLLFPFRKDGGAFYRRLDELRKKGVLPSDTVIATMVKPNQLQEEDIYFNRGNVLYLVQGRDELQNVTNQIAFEAANRDRFVYRVLFGGRVRFETSRFINLISSLPELREGAPSIYLDFVHYNLPAEPEEVKFDPAPRALWDLIGKYPLLIPDELKIRQGGHRVDRLTGEVTSYLGGGLVGYIKLAPPTLESQRNEKFAADLLEASLESRIKSELLVPGTKPCRAFFLQRGVLKEITSELKMREIKPPVEK